MQKLGYVCDVLKELSRVLRNLNLSDATPLEVSFSYIADKELFVTEAIFGIDLTETESDIIIGTSVVKEKDLTQFSDDLLINRIINDIVSDIEIKLLEGVTGGDVSMRIH